MWLSHPNSSRRDQPKESSASLNKSTLASERDIKTKRVPFSKTVDKAKRTEEQQIPSAKRTEEEDHQQRDLHVVCSLLFSKKCLQMISI
jgi:hypothetical protein